ncbi:hypothetical protein HDR66_02045 [bacterium]|nr:hypothetical protein [bacterium]
MKKVVLTSLLAVFAVSGANAANVINNNPLYRPEKGNFYSVTGLESQTNTELFGDKGSKQVKISEEFGYSFAKWWTATVKTSLSESDWFDGKDWNDLSVNVAYRAVEKNNWIADIFGGYGVDSVRADHNVMLDKDLTFYTWTAGVRGGYATANWTVAGHASFDYTNSESFNWDEGFKFNKDTEHHDRISAHWMHFGIDGQLVLNQYWNLVAGAEYNVNYDEWSTHGSYWKGTLGANLNLDETKFVGVYVNKYMARDIENEEAGNWKVADGFEFGVKFGIDF